MTDVPIEYDGWMLPAMRLLVAYIYLRTIFRLSRGLSGGPGLSHPVGIAKFVDLGSLGHKRFQRYVVGPLAIAGTVAFVFEALMAVALFTMGIVVVLQITLASSRGSVNHGDHLIAIVLLAELAATLTWNLRDLVPEDMVLETRSATSAWWASLVIAAVYFTSGLAKVFSTTGKWIHESPGLLTQALIRHPQLEMLGDTRQLRAAARSRRIVDELRRHPFLTQAMFGAGLLLELAAPISLLAPAFMLGIGISLVLLHQANHFLLGLPFRNWQLLVFAFFILPASASL